MCGITGFLARRVSNNQHSILRVMTDQIYHRGPDAVGYWHDMSHGVALGHRRLAIVDLTHTGAQPMVSESGRYILIFNGEIYNHAELRSELNYAWKGNSDTESILAGFDIWGIEKTLKRCVGMFALCVWDKQTRALTLARDRFGEKPLYYGWMGSGKNSVFLFGSDLRALRMHPTFHEEISSSALSSFLQNMAVTGTQSIYKGIQKVSPGTMITVSLHEPNPISKKYWSLEQVAIDAICNPFSGTEQDAVDGLENILKKTVHQQMLADVPLGAFLSGGVDSSTIVALMQSLSETPVQTFCIGFEEDTYSEAKYASAVAKHLGTAHTELIVTPQQALDVIPLLPSVYDEPFADSSQIPTFLLSKITKQHVTVALSGDGGDELFSGYNRYQIAARYWPYLSRVPRPLRYIISSALHSFSPSALDRLSAHLSISNNWIGIGEKLHKAASVLTSASTDELYRGLVAAGWRFPNQIMRHHFEPVSLVNVSELKRFTDIQKMMIMDGLNYLPDDILTKVDRAAMGVSLEVRVPFLDHRVVDFAWSLPSDLKLRPTGSGSITKWALREVLYRHVPKHLIDRPKAGFGVPLEIWLRGPLRDWAEDLLSLKRLNDDGYFYADPIRKMWNEHLSGRRNHQHPLWCVLMFNSWLDGQYRSVARQI